ncbi:peroxiredoxin family protein [Gemmata sp.]|uniref:peroxiredoxin family protein n=1 Tax=Gemmata sp. TaxID=1914242 RepID=UPI003F7275BA
MTTPFPFTAARVAVAAALVAATLAGCTAAAPLPGQPQPKAAPGPKVGEEAKDFELTAIGGETVKLSKLTDAGPVVLVVLRGYPGYQCPLCTAQVGGLLGKADEFKKAGTQVVLVYPGPADKLKEKAAEFVKGKDYPAHFTLVTDPDYAFTNAYGLRWDARSETAYPSTFALDSKRKVTFAKVSTTHGDRSKVDDVLKAVGAR